MGDHEFGQGLKMAATAVVSAVVVAALVITLGGPLVGRFAPAPDAAQTADAPLLVRTGG